MGSHGVIILHDFEDPFLQKKSANDDSSKLFDFISPTISMWVSHILQGKINLITTRILEDFLHGSKPINYESMVSVWLDDGRAPTNWH